MTTSKTPVAIGYRRYSTKGQTSGSSEARQESGFDTYLTTSGLAASTESYWDRGHSGYHGKHLQNDFGRLLADCQAQKFPQGSIVWVEAMDRFGRMKQRDVSHQWGIITLAGYGIHVASVGKTFWEKTPEVETLTVIIEAITAHSFSARLAEKLRFSWDKKREKGKAALTKHDKKSRSCPTWISVSKDGTKYELNDKAKNLRAACLLSIAGHGQTSISKQLGIPQSGLTAYFRSRGLIGEYQPQTRNGAVRTKADAPILDYYPALLTADEFRQLQNSLDARKKQKSTRSIKVSNLFTGMIFNEKREQLGVWTSSTGKQTLRRYVGKWVKRKVKDKDGELKEVEVEVERKWAGGAGVNYPMIEEAILDAFLGLTKHDLYPADSSGQVREAANLEAKIADLTDKVDKWQAEAMEGGAAILSQWATKADAKRSELEEELEAVRTRLVVDKADNLTTTQGLITELLAGAKGAELIDLRSRLKAVIGRDVVRIIVNIHSPYSASLVVALKNGKTIASGKTIAAGSVGKVGAFTVSVRTRNMPKKKEVK